VGNLIRQARRDAGDEGATLFTAALSSTHRDWLRRAALRRHMRLRDLVNRLLTAIAEDRLVDAILDDGENK